MVKMKSTLGDGMREYWFDETLYKAQIKQAVEQRRVIDLNTWINTEDRGEATHLEDLETGVIICSACVAGWAAIDYWVSNNYLAVTNVWGNAIKVESVQPAPCALNSVIRVVAFLHGNRLEEISLSGFNRYDEVVNALTDDHYQDSMASLVSEAENDFMRNVPAKHQEVFL